MNTIFDAIGNDFEKFIAVAEEVFPDFNKKMETKLKEDADAKLLQEEQNLTEDIEAQERYVLELWNEVECAKKNWNSAVNSLEDLKKKREDIHKKWIALHPTEIDKHIDNIIKNAREVGCGIMKKSLVNKPNLHIAFKLICDGIPEFLKDNEYNERCFKRFDNLCHARCKTTKMFGINWIIADVIEAIKAEGKDEFALQIADFHSLCKSKKKVIA